MPVPEDEQRAALENLKRTIVVSPAGRAFWRLADMLGLRPRNPQVRAWLDGGTST